MTSDSPVVDHRVQLVRHHWSPPPASEPPIEGPPRLRQYPTVAVSREAGARGVEVAREIGRQLDWPVYDREIIDMIAEETGLRAELLSSIDEQDPNWLVEAFTSFSRHGAISSAGYVHHLVNVLNALSAHGRCVVVGRGGSAILPRASTLRLRVVADLGDRVRELARERSMSEENASAEVARIDRERAKFVENHFRRDINDPTHFDLVVNTSRLSPTVCAELAVQALDALPLRAAAKVH
jgi:cytidylate kinase